MFPYHNSNGFNLRNGWSHVKETDLKKNKNLKRNYSVKHFIATVKWDFQVFNSFRFMQLRSCATTASQFQIFSLRTYIGFINAIAKEPTKTVSCTNFISSASFSDSV